MIVKLLHKDGSLSIDFHLWDLIHMATNNGHLAPAQCSDLIAIVDNKEIERPDEVRPLKEPEKLVEGFNFYPATLLEGCEYYNNGRGVHVIDLGGNTFICAEIRSAGLFAFEVISERQTVYGRDELALFAAEVEAREPLVTKEGAA